jgi:endonuclease/exonuclease/phosphatase family metal-dependent hydrolase
VAVVLILALAAAWEERGAGAQAEAGGPEPAGPEPAGERSQGELVLATWNLSWLHRSPGSGVVKRSEADYRRLADYARRLDADIVALQEVDGEAAARRIFDPAAHRFHFADDPGNRQNVGFAWRRELDVAAMPDLIALGEHRLRRGADIRVRAHGGEMRLLAIHLKSGCWERPLGDPERACATLARQLPVLEGWIDARAAEGVPFAVLGDFNRRFTAADTFWPELDDAEPPEADLTAVTRGRRSDCWDGRYPDFIDHIVLSRAAGGWLVPGSFRQVLFDPADARHRRKLSDHCPVSVRLAVSAGP